MKNYDVMVFMGLTEISLIVKALDMLRYSKESEKMSGTELLDLTALSAEFLNLKAQMERRLKNGN